MYGRGHPHGTRGERPRRAPVPSAVLARRIVASIVQREREGQPWCITEYTSRPETVALVRQALAQGGHLGDEGGA
jgi:hypothetical protein